jgi:dihydrofolate synthase/folylpolyglutamate synthase
MNYQQTLDYLYARLPMFTKVGASALKDGLSNIIAFCEILDHPEKKFKTIHIAGTNGKGSTSHMLAAILQTAGYKTGLYTSPHLKDFRERIKINGEMISEEAVISFVNDHSHTINTISPSFFEATVAMAFNHFAKNKVDIAVIEVGLGGRLDSTNIINPELSIITNIGFDHVNILGDSLEQIASEKAGIIKKNIPVIIGESLKETKPVFINKAKQEETPIYFASKSVVIELLHRTSDKLSLIAKAGDWKLNFDLDLTATYQLKNIRTVLSAVLELRNKQFNINDQHLKDALKQVKQLTGLMGRWQTLQTEPLVICDNGHNEDGILEVLKNIKLTPHQKLHMVIGMVKDKDISKVLSLLPKEATYYFCSPNLERAKPAKELAAEATAFYLQGKAYSSVREALDHAIASADKDDLIFVGGSTFVVGEIV